MHIPFSYLNNVKNSRGTWRPVFSLLLLMLVASRCESQFRPPKVDVTDHDTVGYRFITQDSNLVLNDAAMRSFYQKLFIQRVSGGERIHVVHIGDSHIQGNFMTQEVRIRLQDAFGDAGRGTVFPYKLAGTNGPRDYLVESNCRWKGANCQKDGDAQTPFGLSGFTLETAAPSGDLNFRLRDTANLRNSPFTRLTVFYRKGPESFDFEIKDAHTNQTARRLIDDDYSSTFFFDRPVTQFTIEHKRDNDKQTKLIIDGISIENEYAGVVYHTIGVNGGRYMDFSRAHYFAEHIGRLQPDLIILSMGTNEAQGASGPAGLYHQMENLVEQLQEQAPGTPILLTTPADSYLRGKGFNPYMPKVATIIRRFGADHQLPVWDLFGMSGGDESAQYWKSNGLMSSDSVHYSKAGYAVQGKLLYLSLIKGYNDFVNGMIQEANSSGK